MSYTVEDESGAQVLQDVDIHEALHQARQLAERVGPMWVRRDDDGMIIGVALGEGVDAGPAMLRAYKHNADNGSEWTAKPRQKPAPCPLTGKRHRLANNGVDWHCADCGQLHHVARGGVGWRRRPLHCGVCGEPAVAMVTGYHGTNRTPMCGDCKGWRSKAS